MNALLKVYGLFKPKDMINKNHGLSDVEKDRITFEIGAVKAYFDETYYLLRNSDVAEAKVDPLLHFLIYGWKEGRDPNSWFSVSYYLESYPDIRAANINPFWHYLVAGKAEGRKQASPAEKITGVEDPEDNGTNFEREAVRDHFDAAYYLRHNPDVAEAKVDPLLHFLRTGWREGRNPNAAFSLDYYLDAYPDVRDAGVNPFWHYLVAGNSEGRLAHHPGGYHAEMLSKTRPLEETVNAWRRRKPPETLLSAAEIHLLVREATEGKGATLMLSVGHDNYREVSGGVQYCIQQEEEAARDRNVLYLNLYPYQPLPRLSHNNETPDVPVSLLLAGRLIGTALMSALTEAVSEMANDFETIEVVVHHLMGHSPEQVTALVRATGDDNCQMWLHDFFTLCPSYALQRNNVTFCNAPPVTSNACRLCLYGKERVDHRARIDRFLEELTVQVLAPSRFTAVYWSERAGQEPARLAVCEHMTIDWTPRQKEVCGPDGPITVAFVGYPVHHKGWPVFEGIVRRHHSKGSGYRFLYFGMSQIDLDEVETIPVHVTAEDSDAMIRAISERNVDIVLHWATCAETFSFSTHEALAAGACVLTNPVSGNVAVTVRKLGQGAVIDDETDLEAFFSDGRVEAMVAEARAQRRRRDAILTRSNLTFSIFDQERHQ